MVAEQVEIPESVLERLRSPFGAVQLINLLSTCRWRVVIRAHPAGGLEGVATRGWETVEVTGDLAELAGRLFVGCMRSSRQGPIGAAGG